MNQQETFTFFGKGSSETARKMSFQFSNFIWLCPIYKNDITLAALKNRHRSRKVKPDKVKLDSRFLDIMFVLLRATFVYPPLDLNQRLRNYK